MPSPLLTDDYTLTDFEYVPVYRLVSTFEGSFIQAVEIGNIGFAIEQDGTTAQTWVVFGRESVDTSEIINVESFGVYEFSEWRPSDEFTDQPLANSLNDARDKAPFAIGVGHAKFVLDARVEALLEDLEEYPDLPPFSGPLVSQGNRI